MSTPPRRQPALRALRIPLLALVASLFTIVVGASQASGAEAAKPRHERPRLSIAVLPSVRQPGPAAASSGSARSMVTVKLRPRSAGKVVKLQRRTGLGWQTIRTPKLRHGKATIPVVTDPTAVYRAILPKHGHRPAIRSNHATDDWDTPDFVDEFDGAALGPAWEHRIQFYNPWGGRACSKGSPEAVSVGDGVLRLSSMQDPLVQKRCLVKDARGRASRPLPPPAQRPHLDRAAAPTSCTASRPPGCGSRASSVSTRPSGSSRGDCSSTSRPPGVPRSTSWSGTAPGAARSGCPAPSTSRCPTAASARSAGRSRIPTASWPPDRTPGGTASTCSPWSGPRSAYIFRIDGHEVWRTREGVSDVHEFLILSMLSSDFELPDVGDDPTPRTAEVDWVAFWQA